MSMSYSCCMMLSSRKIQSILIGIMKNLRCKINKSEAECKTDFRFEKYDILIPKTRISDTSILKPRKQNNSDC